jgi:hypothetical protein
METQFLLRDNFVVYPWKNSFESRLLTGSFTISILERASQSAWIHWQERELTSMSCGILDMRVDVSLASGTVALAVDSSRLR